MVYLEEGQHLALTNLALKSGKSLSALFREAVQSFIEAKRGTSKQKSLKTLSALGSGSKANKDALNHDDILYGSRAPQ